MDYRQFRAFVAVFEERNITQAAQRLYITQPTLSVTIRQLEEMLGVALFKREARGVTVTEAARLLYPQAQRLLAQMGAIQNRFRQTHDCMPLTIGIEEDIAPCHLQTLLTFLQHEQPHLLLTVLPGCTGTVRLGCEALCCEDELFIPLWDEPYVLMTPRHGRSSLPADTGEHGINLAHLPSAEWITCPSHFSHQRFLALLGTDTAALHTSHQAGTLALALSMVAAGLGMALLPCSMATHQPDIQTTPVNGPVPHHKVGLCYTAAARDNSTVHALIDTLQDWPDTHHAPLTPDR